MPHCMNTALAMHSTSKRRGIDWAKTLFISSRCKKMEMNLALKARVQSKSNETRKTERSVC